MIEIRKTNIFSSWINKLKDLAGRAKIQIRIERLAQGNPGDSKSAGDGILELRITYGPGYRVYYTKKGNEFILLLAGGDKGYQSRDIKKAKQLAEELREQNE